MAKDATAAPPARLNITYVPATGDAQEQKELPLRLLMIGDFGGWTDAKGNPLAAREPLRVTRENLDQTLAGVFSKGESNEPVTLDLVVEDTLSEERDAEMTVNLKVTGMKDFTPDVVAPQVPAIKRLLELREALVSLRSPMTDEPELRKKLLRILQSPELLASVMSELGLEPPISGE